MNMNTIISVSLTFNFSYSQFTELKKSDGKKWKIAIDYTLIHIKCYLLKIFFMS